MFKTGGTGEVREPDSETKEIAEKVRGEVEEKMNRKFSVYRPVQVRTQLVAGVNFFIKVVVSDSGECIHLRVYRDLKREISLTNYLSGLTTDSPLEYFQ